MGRDIAELLERVRSATGPDTRIDIAVDDATGHQRWGSGYRVAPPYTASIDAALALTERVLPGFQEVRLQLSLPLGEYCNAAIYKDTFTQESSETFVAPAKTAPLAILTALLSALEAERQTP